MLSFFLRIFFQDLPSANADWQLLDFDGANSKLTEVSPLIAKDTVEAPVVSESDVVPILMTDVSSSEISSSDSMPSFNRSITKAIQLERRRKQSAVSPMKDKDEVELGGNEDSSKSEIDKVLDAAFESMQQDLRNKFDALRESLKKSEKGQRKRSGRRINKE